MLTVEKTQDSNFAVLENTTNQDMHCIAFMASPHNGLESLWFRIKLRNSGGFSLPQTKITLKNVQSLLYESSGLFFPVFRTELQDWERLPLGKKVVLPDGRCNCEWILDTPRESGFLEIAFSYPYDLNNLHGLLKDTGDYWQLDEIGVTRQERPIPRLANCYGDPTQKAPGLFLLARQHAGEVSGSWVLDGMLRRLAEQRTAFPIWCIPFADLDGVCNGDYGKDSFPQDMNRAWGPHTPMRHEIKVISQDMKRWSNRVNLNNSMILDFHSPGADEIGVYTYIDPENQKRYPGWKLTAFVQDLQKAMKHYAATPFIRQCGYKKYSAWGNFDNLDEYCSTVLKVPFCSVETSYSIAGTTILTTKDYQQIGTIFADRLLDYLQSGLFPWKQITVQPPLS